MKTRLLQGMTILMAATRALSSPGWAIQCDGVDDWATLPIPNFPKVSWTLEAWVKFNSLETTSVFHMMAGDSTYLRIVTSNSGRGPHIQLDVGGRGTQPTEADVVMAYNHIAVVVGENVKGDEVNTTAIMYVNGTKSAFLSVPKLADQRPSAELGLCYTRKLLSAMDQREKFGGIVIDDVRFWAEERTQEQIIKTMNTVPSGPNLLHWWAMDNGKGAIVTDSIQGSHGDLAKRRQFTTERPLWIPSGAPIKQANFTAASGVINKVIPLSHPDGSATQLKFPTLSLPRARPGPSTLTSTRSVHQSQEGTRAFN
jgi:hypothetical protein